jgi:hypothetical protein
MNFENILVLPVGISLLAHSGLIFLQSFLKSPSQYDDINNFKITEILNKLSFDSNATIQEFLNTKLPPDNRLCFKDLVTVVLIWSRFLRTIGLLPLMLYIIAIIILLSKFLFTEGFRVELLFNILIWLAFVIQLVYVLCKLISKVSQLLMFLDKYRNVSFLLILLDIVPLLKKT